MGTIESEVLEGVPRGIIWSGNSDAEKIWTVALSEGRGGESFNFNL